MEDQRRKRRREADDPYRAPPEGSFSATDPVTQQKHEIVTLNLSEQGAIPTVFIDKAPFVAKHLLLDALEELAHLRDATNDAQRLDPWYPGEICPYCREGAPEPKGMSPDHLGKLVWRCTECQAVWEHPASFSFADNTYDNTKKKEVESGTGNAAEG